MMPSLKHAIRISQFGGRFEDSRQGEIARPIFVADIHSAYPTAALSLPCLTHGKWSRVVSRRGLIRRIEGAALALVHCRVANSDESRKDWGPLPWRSPDGNIVFPRGGCDTWVWKEEALEAIEHFSQVELLHAFVYETQCECRPFAGLADLYRRRRELESTVAGNALKNVLAATYGKVAQTVGASPFHSPIWASCITSRSRAMLLSAFGVVKRPWAITEFATDAVFATDPLNKLPSVDTGTSDLAKPLGGWEHRCIEGGLFVCRPGMHFALDASENIPADTRARGLGRADFFRHAARIRKHFAKTWRRDSDGYWFAPPYVIKDGAPRFVGMKTGTKKHPDGTWTRSADFGQWIPSTFAVGFEATPKRVGAMRDGRLVLRSCSGTSSAYDPGTVSPLVLAARGLADASEEQHQ